MTCVPCAAADRPRCATPAGFGGGALRGTWSPRGHRRASRLVLPRVPSREGGRKSRARPESVIRCPRATGAACGARIKYLVQRRFGAIDSGGARASSASWLRLVGSALNHLACERQLHAVCLGALPIAGSSEPPLWCGLACRCSSMASTGDFCIVTSSWLHSVEATSRLLLPSGHTAASRTPSPLLAHYALHSVRPVPSARHLAHSRLVLQASRAARV